MIKTVLYFLSFGLRLRTGGRTFRARHPRNIRRREHTIRDGGAALGPSVARRTRSSRTRARINVSKICRRRDTGRRRTWRSGAVEGAPRCPEEISGRLRNSYIPDLYLCSGKKLFLNFFFYLSAHNRTIQTLRNLYAVGLRNTGWGGGHGAFFWIFNFATYQTARYNPECRFRFGYRRV